VPPDRQRFLEAVYVLGAAQLVDPGAFRRLQLALHVLGRERKALRGAIVVVRAQVEVVVGQHGGPG
jgi:hypothetical protein